MSGIDSPTFNDKDADIVFLSSDEPQPVPFHIHSKNLKVSTGAFPPLTMDARGTVGLSRRACDALRASYGFVKDRAVDVGPWAARHGHTFILDEAAPWMTSSPLAKALEALPGRLTLSWIEYHTSWERVTDAFIHFQDPLDDDHQNIRTSTVRHASCVSNWGATTSPMITRFRQSFEAGQNPFLDLDKLFFSPTIERGCWRGAFVRWRESVKGAIEELPKFSDVAGRRSKKDEHSALYPGPPVP
ncbi:hypothetical protein BKA70DRAFT_1426449 [Coprinopsis sp. MPI-PUGE-AT-0042]|nr:hypothetical protein BKA70DRAFT_1426449 [Coprinopsis sp. MPI-PUGE-AT-0042]